MVKFRGLSDRDKQCILDVLGVSVCCFGLVSLFSLLFNSGVVQVAIPWGSGLVVWAWLAGCWLWFAFGLVLGRSVVPGFGSCSPS